MRVVQLVRISILRISVVFFLAPCVTFMPFIIPESPQPTLDNVWSIKVCTGPAWAQFCDIRTIDEVCWLGIGTVCLGVMAVPPLDNQCLPKGFRDWNSPVVPSYWRKVGGLVERS